jgi:hypothetical protein
LFICSTKAGADIRLTRKGKGCDKASDTAFKALLDEDICSQNATEVPKKRMSASASQGKNE